MLFGHFHFHRLLFFTGEVLPCFVYTIIIVSLFLEHQRIGLLQAFMTCPFWKTIATFVFPLYTNYINPYSIMSVHVIYYVTLTLSVHAFPKHWTHGLGIASAELWATSTLCNIPCTGMARFFLQTAPDPSSQMDASQAHQHKNQTWKNKNNQVLIRNNQKAQQKKHFIYGFRLTIYDMTDWKILTVDSWVFVWALKVCTGFQKFNC